MPYLNPTITDFKAFFARDFPFGVDPQTSVTDTDIGKAFHFTYSAINSSLFPDQASYTLGFELLSAHNLVMNLRASSQGINGQFSFTEQSKSVGNVSQAFAIPQRILDNPMLAVLAKTNYGAQYLQMVLPYLTGVAYAVCGATQP